MIKIAITGFINHLQNLFNYCQNSKNLNIFGRYIVALLLFSAFLEVFLQYPSMPEPGLDPSWHYTMKEAMAQNFAIGKDIIFTYGPYAAIKTGKFHPSGNELEFIASIYLAICYSLAILILAQRIKLRWIFAFWAIIAIFRPADPLHIGYPLIVSLIAFRSVFDNHSSQKISLPSWIWPFFLFIIFSPFGLLPLIKLSSVATCFAGIVICSAIFGYNKKIGNLIITILSPIISLCLFWIFAGQDLANLDDYVNMQIISGYTEAMSEEGKTFRIITFIFISILTLYYIYRQSSVSFFLRCNLLLMFAAFFFICFKAGFVRHDVGHVSLIAAAPMLAVFLLPFILKNSRLFIYKDKSIAFITIPILSILSGVLLDKYSYRYSFIDKVINNTTNQKQIYYNIKDRITKNDKFSELFYKKLEEIKQEGFLPILEGKSDIYPWDQSYLIASGNSWSPRPIFQSYSAYTKELAEINAKHLLSDKLLIIYFLRFIQMTVDFPLLMMD